MIRLGLTFLLVALTAPVKAQEAEPKSEDQKVFYLLGASLGQNLSIFSPSRAELGFVKQGLDDYIEGKKLKVDPAVYNPKIRALAEKRQASKAAVEKKKGAEYAAAAAKEKGAVKEKSGLVFIPLVEGKGNSPKASDRVKVHYEGTLVDGTVFDSSVKRGTPAEFPLGGVIPCWTEAVQKMKPGGKAKLICPSSIAYGDSGRPPQIPGGATLVFEVQLLEILK